MRYINEFPDWWPSVVGLDIETTASRDPNPFSDRIVTIQAALPNGDVYIWTEDFEKLNSLFEDSNVLKICHHAGFEYKFLKYNFGTNLWPIFDTMLAERILTSGLGVDVDLASTVWRHCNTMLDKSLQKSFGKGKLTEAQFKYVENDVKYLMPIYELQRKALAKENLSKVSDLENDLVPVVANMELVGIHLDVDAWNNMVEEEIELMSNAARIVYSNLTLPDCVGSLFGNFASPINLNSHPQVLIAFRRSGIAVENTREETLTDYILTHPNCQAVKAYQEYVSHSKMISWDYPKYINPKTGKIHTSYHQIGADTGRFSSSKPNLQNVPRDSRVRRIFIPGPENVFISADYAQQEMRVMADISGDKNLQKVCLEEDPHLANARVIWNDPNMKELKGHKRVIIKNTNFASNYGAGSETFAKSSGISIREADRVLAELKRAYPEVYRWGKKQREFLKENGYVLTAWGRKRRFPGVKENPNLYPNEPINTPIQGTSADMIKRAMVRLYAVLENYNAWIVLQVHDELLVESEKAQAEEVAKIVEREMAAAGAEMIKSIPCPATAKIMERWSK